MPPGSSALQCVLAATSVNDARLRLPASVKKSVPLAKSSAAMAFFVDFEHGAFHANRPAIIR